MTNPAPIRLLEAVSFRSFPATTTVYDGTWAIRLTAGHPAKRLNSVNPLDPNDHKNLVGRIRLAEQRFASFGRPLVFRLTPLAPMELKTIFQGEGWSQFEESIVMEADLAAADIADALDQVPLKDVGRWVDEFIRLSDEPRELKPGLAEIIGATEPETGLFLTEASASSAVEGSDEQPPTASLVRCVCDRSWAGVFDLVTNPEKRQNGHGRSVMKSAMLWSKRHGARKAWLQVVADNHAARSLYGSLGFREVYRYCYWKPPHEQ